MRRRDLLALAAGARSPPMARRQMSEKGHDAKSARLMPRVASGGRGDAYECMALAASRSGTRRNTCTPLHGSPSKAGHRGPNTRRLHRIRRCLTGGGASTGALCLAGGCRAGCECGRIVRAMRHVLDHPFSSIDSTVELGCFGPVGRSAIELRFRHFATVFGLMPWRLARLLRLS